METFSHQQESVERVWIVSRGPHARRPQVCFDLVPPSGSVLLLFRLTWGKEGGKDGKDGS